MHCQFPFSKCSYWWIRFSVMVHKFSSQVCCNKSQLTWEVVYASSGLVFYVYVYSWDPWSYFSNAVFENCFHTWIMDTWRRIWTWTLSEAEFCHLLHMRNRAFYAFNAFSLLQMFYLVLIKGGDCLFSHWLIQILYGLYIWELINCCLSQPIWFSFKCLEKLKTVVHVWK